VLDESINYTKRIEYARSTLWAPFYAVGMTARVQGVVSQELAREALNKLIVLYPPLASRIFIEPDGKAALTTQGVPKFQLDVREKLSDNDWSSVFLKQERLPFNIESGPIAKFFLLRGQCSSDLIIIVPHIICDGYSMTQVMWEAVSLINNPDRRVTLPPQAPSVTWKNIYHKPWDNLFLRIFTNVYNHLSSKKKILIDQTKYREIYQSYWEHRENCILTYHLSVEETSKIVSKCKKLRIAVTSALFAAFFQAQLDLNLVKRKSSYKISIPVNIRNHMIAPPGNALGVYASALELNMLIDQNLSIWEIAQKTHQRIHKLMMKPQRIFRTLVLEELDPRIADFFITSISIRNYQQIPKLLFHYINLKDDARLMTISNIGRINLPDAGGEYPLIRLFPMPPSAPGNKLTINPLTHNGRMTITLKYPQTQFNLETITRIGDRALAYLLNAQ